MYEMSKKTSILWMIVVQYFHAYFNDPIHLRYLHLSLKRPSFDILKSNMIIETGIKTMKELTETPVQDTYLNLKCLSINDFFTIFCCYFFH